MRQKAVVLGLLGVGREAHLAALEDLSVVAMGVEVAMGALSASHSRPRGTRRCLMAA